MDILSTINARQSRAYERLAAWTEEAVLALAPGIPEILPSLRRAFRVLLPRTDLLQ